VFKPTGFAKGSGYIYDRSMSIQELEAEVKRLSPSDLAIFTKWLEKFAASSVNGAEYSAWGNFSAQGLARAYSDSEPEYTLADVKQQ
jgi:hypothetical protein